MFQAFSFIKYLLTAGHRRGHKVHSPFVYDFCRKCLNRKNAYRENRIEGIRTGALHSRAELQVADHGSGTRKKLGTVRSLNKIMRQTAISEKYGLVLRNLVACYQPAAILELGTGLGISTMYLAAAAGEAQVFTIEGSNEIASQARSHFQHTGLQNITLLEGRFTEILPALTGKLAHPLLVFIDGHHDEGALLHNISLLQSVFNEQSILVMDDIHLSREMNQAWQKIVARTETRISIDLFRIGLVFFRDKTYKQHYVIRY